MDDATFRLAQDSDGARRAAETLFDAVAQRLAPLLPPSAILMHIGATAVPGCMTKGDLDIVVRIALEDFGEAEACLAARFTRNSGSVRRPDFAAFEDDTCSPPLGIQLTAKGGAFDDFHILLDALRNNTTLVQRYNQLKLEFDGRPMAQYREAKSAFVHAVLARYA